MTKPLTPRLLLPDVKRIALAAGDIVKSMQGRAKVSKKADSTSVTEADNASDDFICAELARLTPGIPVVSEEGHARGVRPDVSGGTFWVVDPLDATKEYIEGRTDYTVNIGLVVEGKPVLGVIACPGLGLLYAGAGPGTATCRKADGTESAITCGDASRPPFRAMSSRSFKSAPELADFLSRYNITDTDYRGGGVKFGELARGGCNIYPRFGPSYEWDVAAGHAILEAAGGTLTLTDGSPMRYGKPGFANGNFIAAGKGFRLKPSTPKP
jgi:3'(2'), 5'-bisphosphate nucleotidase